jgi:hypothetical protein
MPEPSAPFTNAGGPGGHDAVTEYHRPQFMFLTDPEPVPVEDQRTIVVRLGELPARVTYDLPNIRKLRIATRTAIFAADILAGPSLFARYVLRWNLTLDGEPIPLTLAGLAGMPPGTLEVIAEAIVNDRGPELEATG